MRGAAYIPEGDDIFKYHETIFEQKITTNTSYEMSQMLTIKWKSMQWPKFETFLSSFLQRFFVQNSYTYAVIVLETYILLRLVLPCHSHSALNQKIQENFESKIDHFEHHFFHFWLTLLYTHQQFVSYLCKKFLWGMHILCTLTHIKVPFLLVNNTM